MIAPSEHGKPVSPAALLLLGLQQSFSPSIISLILTNTHVRSTNVLTGENKISALKSLHQKRGRGYSGAWGPDSLRFLQVPPARLLHVVQRCRSLLPLLLGAASLAMEEGSVGSEGKDEMRDLRTTAVGEPSKLHVLRGLSSCPSARSPSWTFGVTCSQPQISRRMIVTEPFSAPLICTWSFLDIRWYSKLYIV
jgi:hypothetical protein